MICFSDDRCTAPSSGRPVKVRFGADEFVRLFEHPPFSDWAGKIELIEGEITRMSPANIPHWRVQQDVAQQLQSIFGPLGPEWLVGSEPTVRFAARTVRLPDVGVFLYNGTGQGIFDVRDLFMAIEVADTTLRLDLGRKRTAYARAGVPHYWVIDVNGRSVHTFAKPDTGVYGDGGRTPFDRPMMVPGTDATITLS